MVGAGGKRWWARAVKQVTKSNFSEVLPQITKHIEQCDFIAVSSQKTGAFTSASRHPWLRRLPTDTPQTAYLKAKLAAEKFELLQFAVCPFRMEGSKVVAFPYNFHLFPRDELHIGMPSYSFSCQTSFLTSMAREGFDFNVCIYDGISYLSRVQESMAKVCLPMHREYPVTSVSKLSVADTVFVERIKSRVQHWRNACNGSSPTSQDALVKSLRKLILGGEVYGSRPCMTIDVCADRQVQLVLQMLSQFSDDLVPLIISDKGGEANAVRVVLTSSEDDKNLLLSELHDFEEEHRRKVRGFRDVIDAMSSSCKPIIGYNCLDDFTFIHSKFLAPLPQSMAEFMCSLRLVFSDVVDVDHLLKNIGPLRRARNLPAAMSYLKRRFFAPLDIETPHQAEESPDKNHGYNVLKIANLFAKLSSILKIDRVDRQNMDRQHTITVEDYANIFHSCHTTFEGPGEEDVGIWMDSVRKASISDLVFLWGFASPSSPAALKRCLHGTHNSFSEDFELKLVDKSCAVVVFWSPGLAEALLDDMESGKIGSGALMEMVSYGLKAAGYEAYKRVCASGFWEMELADAFDKCLSETAHNPLAAAKKDASDIYGSNESMIDLNDL